MKGSSQQGDTADNNNDNNVDGGSAADNNNAEEGQQIIKENNDNDNNNDNIEEEEEEEEEPETQESFTQHEMTQTGNELTQMGLFDDDDDDDDNCNDDQDGNDNSRQPMIDPLTLPWGRLMPVGSNEPSPNTDNTHHNNGGINGTTTTTTTTTTAAYSSGVGPLNNNVTTASAATTTSIRPSTREAIEMLPKSPETRTITRSQSPSIGDAAEATNNNSNYSQDEGITFLGLKNLVCSDRFNEYVLGRSVKADITAQKLDVPSSTASTEQQMQLEEKKRKSHDYIHAMISNRHCRIYCLLNLPNNHTTKTIQHSNNNNHHHPEMEVFVEDTSGNGTLINGTTLLRKNERRKLHTGDVICLLNPKLLYKKIRNGNERKRYMQQYSYVFVNLYEQERHWNYNYSSSQSLCGVGGGGNSPSATSSSSWNRKVGGSSQNSNSNGKAAAVNPRATRCHSTSLGSRDDLTRRKVGGGNNTSSASAAAAAGTNTATAVTNNNNTKGTSAAAIPPVVSRKQSLGSFLNNQSSSSRRRVEDEYDLRDLLGTGTCGEVRRAIHRRTGDERAVKIISITERGMGGANFFSKEKLSSIQAEAEILRSLDHPYVVKLFDVFVAPGKAIYLVMELIKGGDLFDRIVERERYTEVHARRLFRRILAAVHYLHEERGVVHRDLKPENILVVDRRSDVDIKLTDFGLAKNLTAEGLKTFCGTPQYFAPEVLRRRNTVAGNGRYGKEIDCWSIGVILFILLSGSPPFDVSAGFDAVASANVIFYEDQWKHISKDARDLVRRLLEKDATKRMSVKDACEHPWILVDDGDTHCHPLQDPVVTPNAPITKPTESVHPVESKDKKQSLSDAHAMPAPPPHLQIKDNDKVVASEESPKPAKKKRTRDTFLSKSAPQLSKIEHKKNSNSKFSRKSSLLHDSEALQQAVDIPEQKSPTSPLSKKLLFAKPSNEGSVRKISKQNVEQIKTAGNTLPKPSLSAGSRLLPKKKIQQQLGENFKKVETAKAEPLVKPTVQFSSDKENGDSKKRKQSSSTVTPQEQTLVFRLNKKRKTGKNANAEEKEETVNSSVPPPKAELSEDELQSDFSDDEGDVKPRKSPAKKRKIEEFLHKKKSESIQSSASIESLDRKELSKSTTTRISLSPNLGKNALASQEHDTKGVEHDSDKPVERPLKSKKKKQTFLFGKPPPSGFESTVGIEESVSPTSDAADSDSNPIAEEGGKESVELERQPSSESMTGQATISSTKGTQKSIKNWFQPKK